jgi:hypothetical protein
MAGKTVTIRKARPFVRSVTVAGHRFVVGEAVRDVPDDVLKELRARDDLTLHVAVGRSTSTSSDEPEEGEEQP